MRCGPSAPRRRSWAVSDGVAAEHPGWPRFRVGVNTGEAVVGNVGGGAQRSFAAIGDTTNLASRLVSAAQAGQVILGPRTWRAVQSAMSAAPLGALQLKGKREPVEAWALTGPQT
jgi:adenylate cyclase